MNRKIRIQRTSFISTALTVILAVAICSSALIGWRMFTRLQESNHCYTICQEAAKQLEDGSDYLTEQVRLYAMTGEKKYMISYFEEADVNRRRDKALAELSMYFDSTDAFCSLKSALNSSQNLMETEYRSMRLISEAYNLPENEWPDEIRDVRLSAADAALSSEEKCSRGRDIVFDSAYQSAREEILSSVKSCTDSLIKETDLRQNQIRDNFKMIYLASIIGIVLIALLSFGICIMIRRLVVLPLISYNDSVKKGVIFPVTGAAELQTLAETYNAVFIENQETQKLIRHQAEYDSMTELLNHGSFDRLLKIYKDGDSPFALHIIDIDDFKHFNDTYGHAVGDDVLRKVASALTRTFRSIDYICRIGGDEFAVIMVDMPEKLMYVVDEKMNQLKKILSVAEDNIPPVTLSIGVAFSDSIPSDKDIFNTADAALYQVKENGKNNYKIYK